MKKIFLIRNIEPTKYGGGEAYQVLLANELKKNGFCPIIITASTKLLNEAQKNNIKYIEAPYIKRQNWSGLNNLLLPVYFVQQMRLYFWYKKQIKKHNPIALNIQSRDEQIAATIAGKKMKKNILWTDHADFRTWTLVNVDKPLKNIIGKRILKLAKKINRIIFISDFEYASFRKITKTRSINNVCVVKNGVIDEKKKYDTLNFKEKSFCYVGRIVNDKGIRELIRAFKKINDANAELRIYGDGEDLDKCKQLVAKDERIKIKGYTDDPLGAIAGAEFFVLPSYHEGLSLSLIQATMMQKNIIATNVDGNPEIVEDEKTGLLVQPKNDKELFAAMMRFLKCKKETKDKMALRAREKYEKEFNFEKIVKEKIVPLLEDM